MATIEHGPRVSGTPIFGVIRGTGGGAFTDIPVLSSPGAGTPSTTSTANAVVTSSAGSGRLYWAVVTNGGSATNAQIIAGSGGNIVVAGSQAITASGIQTVASITGLTTGTTYQILYLVVGGSGLVSLQSSVTLITV